MVHLGYNRCLQLRKMERERKGKNFCHCSKSATVDRPAWAQEAESIKPIVITTPQVSLAQGTDCLYSLGYSLFNFSHRLCSVNICGLLAW